MAITVAELRAALAHYPDNAHVGVHVLDHKSGHRFISAERIDMTPPNEHVPVHVVWISSVRDGDGPA
jgi:hypothetical protein